MNDLRTEIQRDIDRKANRHLAYIVVIFATPFLTVGGVIGWCLRWYFTK